MAEIHSIEADQYAELAAKLATYPVSTIVVFHDWEATSYRTAVYGRHAEMIATLLGMRLQRLSGVPAYATIPYVLFNWRQLTEYRLEKLLSWGYDIAVIRKAKR